MSDTTIRSEADNPTATVRLCIDADCPNCGWPERWAEVSPDSRTLHTYGCPKCEYRSMERDT